MRATVARKIRHAQDETVRRLIIDTHSAYARVFAMTPFWRRLWWAVRGRIG